MRSRLPFPAPFIPQRARNVHLARFAEYTESSTRCRQEKSRRLQPLPLLARASFVPLLKTALLANPFFVLFTHFQQQIVDCISNPAAHVRLQSQLQPRLQRLHEVSGRSAGSALPSKASCRPFQPRNIESPKSASARPFRMLAQPGFQPAAEVAQGNELARAIPSTPCSSLPNRCRPAPRASPENLRFMLESTRNQYCRL